MPDEPSSVVHDRLFVLDLDRCLITAHLYEVFNEVVAESGVVDLRLLQEARHNQEVSGGSFDTIGWLQSLENVSVQQCDQILAEAVDRARNREVDTFLSPGTRQLLSALEALAIPHMIMTYGGSAYQVAKIKAVNLETIPHTVVEHKHKGQFISGWWDEQTGYFTAQLAGSPMHTKKVVLVDDKAGAFEGLPVAPYARGYWLKAGSLLSSQQGNVPSNVKAIASLDEILGYENL